MVREDNNNNDNDNDDNDDDDDNNNKWEFQWLMLNWNVVFCGGRKTRVPGEKSSEQPQQPTTNFTHV